MNEPLTLKEFAKQIKYLLKQLDDGYADTKTLKQ